MGKKKSAVFLVLITIAIAVLLVLCVVPFGTIGIKEYHSLAGIMKNDSYFGGGYTVVYYPEGVIPESDYRYLEDSKDEYVQHKNTSLYLKSGEATDEVTDEVLDRFKESFAINYASLRTRFAQLHYAGTRVDIADDYSVRVELPTEVENLSNILTFFSYTGTVNVAYGTSEDDATVIIEGDAKDPVTNYLKSTGSISNGATSYVALNFTDAGREAIYNATADSATTSDSSSSSSKKSLYFRIGENTVVTLSVDSPINQETLYVNSAEYTAETASVVSALFNDALETGEDNPLKMSVQESRYFDYGMGKNILPYLYVATGVILLLTLVFFFVRYHLLGFVHLYTLLTYSIIMILCLSLIPGVYLSVASFTAAVLGMVLLSLGDFVSFEYAKREYATGKTMSNSVKQGYAKCTWHIFDVHVALAIVSLITFFIALTELKLFALIFVLATAFSGLLTLIVNRFYWAIMMALSKKPNKFCAFKQEVFEDD